MKVKLTRTPGIGWDCKLTEGQTGDVSEKLGASLVAAGLAVKVKETRTVKAVAKPAAIGAAKTDSHDSKKKDSKK